MVRIDGALVVGLLGLDPGSGVARAAVDFIGEAIAESARRQQRWAGTVRGLPGKRRGRPGKTIDELRDVELLAFIFEYCTGHKARNSIDHCFYKLVQHCLGQADPSKLIALCRPTFDRPDYLAWALNHREALPGLWSHATEFAEIMNAAGLKVECSSFGR